MDLLEVGDGGRWNIVDNTEGNTWSRLTNKHSENFYIYISFWFSWWCGIEILWAFICETWPSIAVVSVVRNKTQWPFNRIVSRAISVNKVLRECRSRGFLFRVHQLPKESSLWSGLRASKIRGFKQSVEVFSGASRRSQRTLNNFKHSIPRFNRLHRFSFQGRGILFLRQLKNCTNFGYRVLKLVETSKRAATLKEPELLVLENGFRGKTLNVQLDKVREIVGKPRVRLTERERENMYF